MGSKTLNLLPPEALVKTGYVDHADWNYKPLLGTISRARFRLAKELFGKRHFERLLEIGYGSGVFLPELSFHADEIYGVDVHNEQDKVARKLAEHNVSASLSSGGAEVIGRPDDFFDLVVAVSALEFVSDLDAVCKEVLRVLKREGNFVVVTPGISPLLDLGLKMLTGKSAKDDFADRRELILPTLRKHFEVRRELTYPKYGATILRLYTALELTPREA